MHALPLRPGFASRGLISRIFILFPLNMDRAMRRRKKRQPSKFNIFREQTGVVMAEQVHLHLEQCLVGLKELEKGGIFSEAKIKDILRARTKYEYRLKRRAGVLQKDFLEYIEYEKMLEMQRVEIMKRMEKKHDRRLEFLIVKHICDIYKRALVKFGHDQELWKTFVDYLISQKCTKLLEVTFNKCLKLHPRSEELWIKAASYEWIHNGNAEGARNYFYRALRIIPDGDKIYHAFINFEIDFALNYRERRETLGLDVEATNPAGKGELINIVLADALEKNLSADTLCEIWKSLQTIKASFPEVYSANVFFEKWAKFINQNPDNFIKGEMTSLPPI